MGALFSGSVAHRHYNSFVRSLLSQQGKFFAITGTSSGIGLEAARAVVRSGGNVLCLNRPSERAATSLEALKAECVDGATATGVACDLEDLESVRSAAAAVRQHVDGTGLYALLNNAGCMGLPERATKDGFDVQMQTNHLSHFLLTSLLMPALERSVGECGDARVVNQTGAARNMDGNQTLGVYPLEAKFMQPLLLSESTESEDKGLGGDSDAAAFRRYQQTKLANLVFTLSLADKLKENGSKVKALVSHPGICETAFNPKPGQNVGFFGRMLMSIVKTFISQSCGDGAMPMIAAAVNADAESGDLYGPSHLGFIGKMLGEPMTGLPQKVQWDVVHEKEAAALDPKGHEMLWVYSEEAIGQSFFG